MIVHNYDAETGEYYGSAAADPSPCEEGVYLIPAYTTDIAPPPISDREAAVWSGSAWNIVADYRGQEYYLPDGSQHQITHLGVAPPMDALPSPPVPLPGIIKRAARSRIDGAAERARLQWITPGAGQALVYQRKETQARACLVAHDVNNPPPTGAYPALDIEVGITGADTRAVAQTVVALADQWGAIADAIEAQRLSAKAAIAAIPDNAADIEAQIAAIEAGIVWPTP